MATVTFNVPQDLITKLAGGEIAIGRFLLTVLGDYDPAIICAELIAFHDDVGGSPEIKTFDIIPEEVVYDQKPHTGKLVFRYRVRFFFGCSDINNDEPANEKADFEIDTVNKKLYIHIHDPIRRDTIDEF